MDQQATLLFLPDEVLRIIIEKCTTVSIARLKQCCNRLQYIIERYKLQHVSADFLGVVYAGHDGPVQAHLVFPEGNICKPFQVPSLHLPVSVSLYDVMAKINYVDCIRFSGTLNQYVSEVMMEFKHKIRNLRLNYTHVRINFEGFITFLKLFQNAELQDLSLLSFSPDSQMLVETMSSTSITLTGVDLPEVNDDILPILEKMTPAVFHINLCTTNISLQELRPTIIAMLNRTERIDWNFGFVRIENDEEMKAFVYDMWSEYYFKVTCDGDNIMISSDTDGVHKVVQLQRKNYFEQQLGLQEDF